jgi:hypothetical protein
LCGLALCSCSNIAGLIMCSCSSVLRLIIWWNSALVFLDCLITGGLSSLLPTVLCSSSSLRDLAPCKHHQPCVQHWTLS